MEDLKQRQLLEERQLPKVLKEEHKVKIAEAKKMMKGKKDIEKLRQASGAVGGKPLGSGHFQEKQKLFFADR